MRLRKEEEAQEEVVVEGEMASEACRVRGKETVFVCPEASQRPQSRLDDVLVGRKELGTCPAVHPESVLL